MGMGAVGAAVTRPRMYCHGHNNMRVDGGGGKGEEDGWAMTHLRLLLFTVTRSKLDVAAHLLSDGVALHAG